MDRVKDLFQVTPSLVSAALTFCTSFDAVSTVIPGAVSEKQLLDNLDAMKTPLQARVVDRLQTFYEQEVRALRLPW